MHHILYFKWVALILNFIGSLPLFFYPTIGMSSLAIMLSVHLKSYSAVFYSLHNWWIGSCSLQVNIFCDNTFYLWNCHLVGDYSVWVPNGPPSLKMFSFFLLIANKWENILENTRKKIEPIYIRKEMYVYNGFLVCRLA